ncbi:hypothetical protein ACIRD3_33075 [Kitasatospora sp. NPDC093550]|uniref:hypothetical protein n=1 Tax=Kitasatospora sp. NPDC093550 TaxID=3364089 RepID=UPI0037F7AB70
MLSCRKFACTAAAAIALACGVLAGSAQAATGHGPTSGQSATASVSTALAHLADKVHTPRLTDVPAIDTPGDWRWE